MDVSNIRVVETFDPTATGTTEVDGNIVDMSSVEEAIFVTRLGTANAGNGQRLEQGDDSGLSDAAVVAGSNLLGKRTLVTKLIKPQDRYVRPTAIRAGATTTIEAGFAILIGPRTRPQDSTATNVAEETLVSPAEGAA